MMPEAARARLARPHAGTALAPQSGSHPDAPLVGEELFPDSGFVVGVKEGAERDDGGSH
jgi:hypothetical protein